jgi:hypothetical protein
VVAAVGCDDSKSGPSAGAGAGAGVDAGAGQSGEAGAVGGAESAGADSGVGGAAAGQAGAAAEEPAACLHDVCAPGALLDASCSACVAAVCEVDEYCCLVRWEDQCVALALEQPQCSCAPEASCSDLVDDDQDQAFDCDDTDCHAAGACEVGEGVLGGPCAQSSDCAATGEDPLCIDEARYEWPGGFCTELCSLAEQDCAAGGECQDIGLPEGRGVCQVPCDIAAPSPCREGYECKEDRGAGPYCQPMLEICDNGVDDDLDGPIDCEEHDCLYADNCTETCDNGQDDNADGKADCEDVRCIDAPECAWRVTATCSDDRALPAESCVELGTQGFPCDPITNAGCLPEQSCELVGGTFLCFGPPNDIAPCERCGGLRGRCAAGTTCMTYVSARCAPFCCTDADCGEGSTCNREYVAFGLGRMDSPVGVCAEGPP